MGKYIEELISIVIPVYNVQDYLVQCLDSVINQTYQNIEIIVVNDGSTDYSLDIISRYSKRDNRIVIIDQENKGLSEARNVGMRLAHGKYIIFLDSDDWLDLETCEMAYNTLKNKDVDVVMWAYSREYPSKRKAVFGLGEKEIIYSTTSVKKLYQQMVGLNGKQLQNPQMTDAIITAWGKLYRRSIIGDIEFVDTKVIGTEDALFNIQVFSKVKKAVYLPKTFSHYRKTNENSLTRKYKSNLVFQWKNLYEYIELHLKRIQASQNLYKALNNRICLGLIGLGLNIIEDSSLSNKVKRRELRKILSLPHYKEALANFSYEYLPIHWKVFFFMIKKNYIGGVYVLLIIMNYLRKK